MVQNVKNYNISVCLCFIVQLFLCYPYSQIDDGHTSFQVYRHNSGTHINLNKINSVSISTVETKILSIFSDTDQFGIPFEREQENMLGSSVLSCGHDPSIECSSCVGQIL